MSNRLGIQYNTFKKSSEFKVSFMPNKLTSNNVEKMSFKEGSGDNMILGHILCSKLPINGIRNSFNQDELAVCNPKNFFKIADKRIINLKNLGYMRNNIYSISFNKKSEGKPMQYKSRNSNLIKKTLNNVSSVNIKNILNNLISLS